MAYNEETIAKVSHELEALLPALSEMVTRLRTGEEEQPYAALYWARREMSRMVTRLGEGAPNTAKVERTYTAQMQG